MKKIDLAGVVLAPILYTIYFIWDMGMPYNLLQVTQQSLVPPMFPIDVTAPIPWRYRIIPTVLLWLLGVISRAVPFVSYNSLANFANLAATVATLIAFYVLLRKYLEVSTGFAIVGAVSVTLSYPILFAYRALIWGKFDDPLTYAFITLGLIALCAGRHKVFTLLAVVAMLTRETALVLLLAMLVDKKYSWTQKTITAIIVLSMASGIRVLLGWETQYLQVGWEFNLSEPKDRTISHLFSTFGVFWFIGLVGWLHFRLRIKLLIPALQILSLSAPLVVGTLVVANTAGAILRENRILFAVFPWVIGIGIAYLNNNLARIGTWAHLKIVSAILIAPMLAIAMFLYLVPGGEGQRLTALSVIPFMTQFLLGYFDLASWFAHFGIWIEVSLINFVLTIIFITWIAVDWWLRKTRPLNTKRLTQ